MPEFEFLRPEDKPAIVASTNPEVQATAKTILEDLGYKVHVARDHADFGTRFSQFQYQVVVMDELFNANSPEENFALQNLQMLPMTQRRHAVVVLIGPSFKTLNSMQAFRQSVHAVVNPTDLTTLAQIIQQAVADNDLFLSIYRDTQLRMAQGKM
jgi:CheY-like chemotaxis protein